MSSKMEEELLAGETQGEGKNGGVEGGGGTATDSQLEQSPVTLVEVSESVPSSADDPIAKLEGEVERWKDLAMRSQAELENFRKRMAREKSEAIRFGNAALLESLLPVVDNFRFGLEAARQEGGQSVVFQGMSMVFKQLTDFLEELGVKEVVAEGMPFDPNLHHAVKQEASEEVQEGHVISVIRRGFRLQDRLLRAAEVIVSSGPAKSPETGPLQPEAGNESIPSLAD